MTPEELRGELAAIWQRATADVADAEVAQGRASEDLTTAEQLVQACTGQAFTGAHVEIVAALVEPSRGVREATIAGVNAALARVVAASTACAMADQHVALQAAGAAGAFYQKEETTMPDATGPAPQQQYTHHQVKQIMDGVADVIADVASAQVKAALASIGIRPDDYRYDHAVSTSVDDAADEVHARMDEALDHVAELLGVDREPPEPDATEPQATMPSIPPRPARDRSDDKLTVGERAMCEEAQNAPLFDDLVTQMCGLFNRQPGEITEVLRQLIRKGVLVHGEDGRVRPPDQEKEAT